MSEKKWEILHELSSTNKELRMDTLQSILLGNRGLSSKEEIEEFLHPKLTDVTTDSVGIDTAELKKATKRILQAITQKQEFVIFGDYDVDGICGAAVLWETFYAYGGNVVPYIPHRVDEGYGLSAKGIANVKLQMPNLKLIITVDNGIVAHDAVRYAKTQGVDVIITDHHVKGEKVPDAHAIVHTTKLCGTGVGYMLSEEFKKEFPNNKPWSAQENHLELVALATIADLVPLVGANRTLTKFGIERLHHTKRIGLLELYKEAALEPQSIGVYEIGHLIAPRLNAMGRMEYAMESLRLVCTKNQEKASLLAQKLGQTNKDRQVVTFESVLHAKTLVKEKKALGKLLFIAHESYQQGVIGLIAGRLVEEYYLPSIVVAIGETHSKASARSIKGFNIIEFIRSASEFLVDAGGHPMAAGFTVETAKLPLLQKTLESIAEKTMTADLLQRTIKIDLELQISQVSEKVFQVNETLSPFGMGNPEPTFMSKNIEIADMRLIGKDKNHVKLQFKTQNANRRIDAIAFNMGERAKELAIGSIVDAVYTVDMNEWNGNTTLQLKIKDIKPAS